MQKPGSSTAGPRAICLTLGALLLSGCTVGPDFERPAWASPSTWFSSRPKPPVVAVSQTVTEPIDPNWWSLFDDRQLTALERRVAAQNLDVRAATARIAEARYQRDIAASSAYPMVNGNASYERLQASNNGIFSGLSSGSTASAGAPSATSANGALGNTAGGVSGSKIPPLDIYQYGFDASWEIDLWGQVRRSVEAANASITASADDRRNLLLIALADVATDYLQLRGVQTQIAIAYDNLRSARQSLELTQQRAAGGVTTDLDVANASAQVRTTAATIPALENREAALINALGLLLGQPPNALRAELADPKPVPPVPPTVPVGVPSELARRRPDIRQAEAQLHAATADIGVAVAAFYPTVTLSGSLGIQATNTAFLFNGASRQFAFGPSITLPIFEGGQLKATLELRKAQQQEVAVNYQHVVLNAWTEVDNALTAYQTEQGRRDQLIQAVAQNQRALSLAQARYAEGVTDFLQVLDAQRNLFSTQDQLAQSTTAVSTNLVSLYKALGGGWETDFPAGDKVAQQ
jgi:NodT family efflux transporter outer membrane factor (OMF) lipoprotein